MTDTTESQARAIAEALGWEHMAYWWRHEVHGHWFLAAVPRLTDDTTPGRAMCYDAIVWLSSKCLTLDFPGYGEVGWVIHNREEFKGPNIPAALEAAMIKELGL